MKFANATNATDPSGATVPASVKLVSWSFVRMIIYDQYKSASYVMANFPI